MAATLPTKRICAFETLLRWKPWGLRSSWKNDSKYGLLMDLVLPVMSNERTARNQELRVWA